MPHAAFYVVQLGCCNRRSMPLLRFNAARSILCGATCKTVSSTPTLRFQCRTQHFMWCNKILPFCIFIYNEVSMPHAAFYVVQLRSRWCWIRRRAVSMPHAAFYVVQLSRKDLIASSKMFQCRTQHFMWCNPSAFPRPSNFERFQCRTQHFMWCNEEGFSALFGV